MKRHDETRGEEREGEERKRSILSVEKNIKLKLKLKQPTNQSFFEVKYHRISRLKIIQQKKSEREREREGAGEREVYYKN